MADQPCAFVVKDQTIASRHSSQSAPLLQLTGQLLEHRNGFDLVVSTSESALRCIQSPKCGNNNEPLDKKAAMMILEELAGRKK